MALFPFQLKINSDNALLIQFECQPSSDLSEFIHSYTQVIPTLKLNGFIESVAAYQSILVIFDTILCNHSIAIKHIESSLSKFTPSTRKEVNVIQIPVCYDSKLAPDLISLCETKRLSTQEFIAIHSQPQYRVEMLGFLPGFLYLSGLDKKLSQPRKSNPAFNVPAGSVGIGGNQTGIYPIDSPGGWHIIGRTPLTLFTPESEQIAIAQPLDYIKFQPISYKDYLDYEH